MVSVTGHISGGQVNPAVTIALWAAGKIGTQRGAVLIVAQLVGAVMGALLLRYAVGDAAFDAGGAGAPALAPGVAVGRGIVIEAILTFFLVFVVFGTVVDDKGPWNKTAGFTIGFTIAFDILAFGPLTGAAMNPARWFGPALVGGIWENAVVWVVGPISGAIIAGVLYTAVLLRGREPATP
jgi:aquaporin Z